MSPREGDGDERLAPVTYLPGVRPATRDRTRSADEAGGRSETETGAATHDDAGPGAAADEAVRWAVPLESASSGIHPWADAEDQDDDRAADAEQALTRRLRRSALSEREARSFLVQRDVAPVVVEATVERFIARGWIDDAVLAEQLLYAGTSRKGQGRRAIGQTLAARGIPRDVADAALEALPDDDAERALEYARSKAGGLRSYDMDTAMRRLMGQLARRGYAGSVASTAARTALTENTGGSGGVRFR